MTIFEEAAQSPSDMAVCIAGCIAGYLNGSGIHDFSDDNELIQFITVLSPGIEEWLNGESGGTA